MKAKVNQLPLPERLPRASSTPSTARPVRNVRWAPPGGALRDVPACAMDADAIERGFDPQMREVVLPNGQRAPYWAAGPAYQPYANGYYGGFDGLLTGMLVGTMLGSAFGGFGYGGYGGEATPTAWRPTAAATSAAVAATSVAAATGVAATSAAETSAAATGNPSRFRAWAPRPRREVRGASRRQAARARRLQAGRKGA